MESRQAASHPFSQPPAQPHEYHGDARYGPIPPPPYSFHPGLARPEPSQHNDPFLPRRHKHSQTETSIGVDPSRPYTYFPPTQYPSRASHDPSDRNIGNIQTQRRGSYGSIASPVNGQRDGYGQAVGDDHFHHPQHQPAGPSSSSASLRTASAQSQYAPDRPRRFSLNGDDPPKMYGAVVEHPPPPPAPFAGRQMLPPSSPKHVSPPYSLHAAPARGSQPLPSFSRDLPALASSHRPGSSMSISSMLGGEAEKTNRDKQHTSHGPTSMAAIVTTIPSPSARPVPASSQSQRSYVNGPLELHATSPDYSSQVSPHTRNVREAYRDGPYQSSPSLQQHSPPHSQRNSMSTAHTIYSPAAAPHYSPKSTTPQQQAWDSSQSRQNDMEVDHTILPTDMGSNNMSQMTEKRIDGVYSRSPKKQRGEHKDARKDKADEQRNGDRYHRESNLSHSGHASKTPSVYSPRKVENAAMSNYPFLSRPRQQALPASRSEQRDPPTVKESSSAYLDELRASGRSPSTINSSRHARGSRPADSSASAHAWNESPINAQPHPMASMETRETREPPRLTSAPYLQETISIADRMEQQYRTLEEAQASKPSPGLSVDFSKRGGRLSPLPQAVQGVQGQLKGPTSEPGIKNEFARMFSGIGSGVGSATPTASVVEPGMQGSFPSSPSRTDDVRIRTPFSSRGDLLDYKPRVSSRGGRKSRKVKEEETKIDSENGDAKTSMSHRGTKRSRPSHHHHQHNHHHHHHHHHNDPSNATLPLTFSNSTNTKRTATPVMGQSSTPVPHHHHHNTHHHHHHHASKASQQGLSRQATIVVNSKAVLDEVKGLPRFHLGSTLYSPKLIQPSATGYQENARNGFVSTPRPLPRFDGKENCTFTIRVPRFYLQKSELEEICARRAVWGSDVFTDDSDPLAASIHSGWIRGEWGEDIDTAMMDLGINETLADVEKVKSIAKAFETITSLPSRPISPPKDMDLHITVLILPPLEKYATHVAHGIKSRAWDTKHDGLSFQIQQIAWIDDGIGRAEERTGEARRKRLKALMNTRNTTVGPPIRLNLVARDLNAMNPTAVAA